MQPLTRAADFAFFFSDFNEPGVHCSFGNDGDANFEGRPKIAREVLRGSSLSCKYF